jgi:hypothetical protein
MTDEAKGPSHEREVRQGMFVPGGNGGPGRPYTPPTPEQCRLAKHVCRLGATDQDIAAALDVSSATIKKWQVMDEDFSFACKVGGDMADARIERALFQRAAGGTRTGWREQVTKSGEIVTLSFEEELPPDTAAASRWLESRKRKDWGVKSVIHHEGDLEVRDSRSALAMLVARQLKAAAQSQALEAPATEGEFVEVHADEANDESR